MIISTSTAFVFVSLAFNAASTFGAPIPSRLLASRDYDLVARIAGRSPQPTPSADIQHREPEPQRLGRRFPQPFSADDLKSRDLIARRSRDLKSRLEQPQGRTPDDEVNIIIVNVFNSTSNGDGEGTGNGDSSGKSHKGKGRKGKGRKGKGGCRCAKNKKSCKGKGRGKRPVNGIPKPPVSTELPEGSLSMLVPMGSPKGPNSTLPEPEILPTTKNVKGSPEPPSNSTTAPETGDSGNGTTTTTSAVGQPTPPIDAGQQKRQLFARLKEARSAGARSRRSLRNRTPS